MEKILLIEDDADLQQTMGKILKDNGFQVIEALDGEIGVELAKSEKPDIALVDLILPKKNGFDVIKELKEDPETENIKIIVLTNLESSLDIERALELGATTYLVKTNYSLEDVVKRVKELLEQ